MKQVTINLPGSGLEIRIRRIPFIALERIQTIAEKEKADSKPKPPTMKVQTGPENFELIADENDKDYLVALGAWKKEVTAHQDDLIWDMLLKAGIIYELTEDDKTTIADLREIYGRLEMKLPDSDRMFWLRFIAAPTVDDYRTLLWECFGKSSPSEAQVAFHRILFQRKVQEPSSGVLQES